MDESDESELSVEERIAETLAELNETGRRIADSMERAVASLERIEQRGDRASVPTKPRPW